MTNPFSFPDKTKSKLENITCKQSQNHINCNKYSAHYLSRVKDNFIISLNYVKVVGTHLTLCLPVSSADNLGKQFGPRSGPTNRRA